MTDDIITRAPEIVAYLRQHKEWPLLNTCADLIDAMSARIAELEALVTAAKRDLRTIADGNHTWMCQFCTHCRGTDAGIADCDLTGIWICKYPFSEFEWRGADMREVQE